MSLFSLRLGQAHLRLAEAGATLVAVGLLAGCGNGYRPVVTPINPTGPAAQPSSLVAVVSSPSATSPGVATIIDYSGDTIVAQAPIGVGPITFAVDQTGSNGYTINRDGTLTNFPVSTTLQQKNINYTTLPSTANPISLFAPNSGLWAADLSGNLADVFSGLSPTTFKLSVPVAPTPVMVIGVGTGSQRNYVVTQGAVSSGVACNQAPTTGPAGEVDAVETTNYTISARIPLGKCPVYAVSSSSGQRVFVLNRGDDTITVINAQTNTLDQCAPFQNQSGQTVTCHPTLPLSTTAVTATGVTPPNGIAGMTATAGPVYAEYIPATSQLVVADYDGGAVSVIDVSLDQFGNDSSTFGTTFTIPVGANPASVTALYDGSRAYTANQTDGTVSIVNLSSHTLEKSLSVNGNPRTVVSTQNSLYGKVYVSSPNSPYLTIIRTDQDIIDSTVLVQGDIVDVRVSTQNAFQGNSNPMSRTPGYGQPCYLPPALMNSTYGPGYTLANCTTLP